MSERFTRQATQILRTSVGISRGFLLELFVDLGDAVADGRGLVDISNNFRDMFKLLFGLVGGDISLLFVPSLHSGVTS